MGEIADWYIEQMLANELYIQFYEEEQAKREEALNKIVVQLDNDKIMRLGSYLAENLSRLSDVDYVDITINIINQYNRKGYLSLKQKRVLAIFIKANNLVDKLNLENQ